jgi:GNAT superfamily N-acetyltransferase
MTTLYTTPLSTEVKALVTEIHGHWDEYDETNPLDDPIYLLIADDNAGFAWVFDEGTALYVRWDKRSRGVGTKLVEAVKQLGRKQGKDAITLQPDWSEISPYYRSLGFKGKSLMEYKL